MNALLAALVLGPALWAGQVPEGGGEQPFRLCAHDLPRIGAWRYHPGDDPEFAAPDLDDSAWLQAPPYFPEDAPPPDWTGVGWFRGRFSVPPPTQDALVGIYLSLVGKLSLYVDGERVDRFSGRDRASAREGHRYAHGELGAVLRPTRSEVLVALRVETPPTPLRPFVGPWRGTVLELCEMPNGIQTRRHRPSVEFFRLVYTLFIGFTTTLSLLYFLLYLCVRAERRGHLDYAMFTLATGVLSICVLARSFGGPVELIRLWTVGFLGSILLLAVFGVRFFIGAALGETDPRRIWVLWAGVPAVALAP